MRKRGLGQALDHINIRAERENLMLNQKIENKRGVNVYQHKIRGKPE